VSGGRGYKSCAERVLPGRRRRAAATRGRPLGPSRGAADPARTRTARRARAARTGRARRRFRGGTAPPASWTDDESRGKHRRRCTHFFLFVSDYYSIASKTYL
jgi:hypothetical protein